ncbi:MAG: hypothetical protein J5I91_05960 [Bacteroidetes bacterium]|nr:hypothetical protein [Bacteroidota bacterium]
MKRIHVLEWEDLQWFPKLWRDFGTSYLKFMATRFDIYKPVLPIIKTALEKSTHNQWVDLASGGGSGLINIASKVKKENPEISIILTDYYPNIEAFESLRKEYPNTFTFEKEPVDATNPPKHLSASLKTIFGAFHHFRPKGARQILQNAVNTNSVILVFEPVGRNFGSWFSMLFVPLNLFVFTPFIRPLKWQVLPFIYLIPIIPIYVLWDGIASILRTYSSRELHSLVDSVENSNLYHWEIGKTSGPMPIHYLFGYKKL